MRTSVLLLITMLLGVLGGPLAYSDSHGAVATMANIMIGLKHFPTDEDKAALAAIASGDNSDAVKAVANAIANISHTVSVEDQTRLAEIAGDRHQSAKLRELAAIVKGINHMPNADAVAALRGIAGHGSRP